MNKKLTLLLLVFASIVAQGVVYTASSTSSNYDSVSAFEWDKFSLDDVFEFGAEQVIKGLEHDGYKDCVVDDSTVSAFKKKSGSYYYFKFTDALIVCEGKYKEVQFEAEFVVKQHYKTKYLKLYSSKCSEPKPVTPR